MLGNETPLSVAIRRFLSERPDAAQALFGEERLPTLCQYDPTSRYFEAVEGGTLAFSGDNGVPLIRYHIADHGGILRLRAMRAKLADYQLRCRRLRWRRPGCRRRGGCPSSRSSAGPTSPSRSSAPTSSRRPSAWRWRSRALSGWTTGKFVMEVKEGLADRPRFTVAIELAGKEAADPTRIELAEREILETLVTHNSEYANYVSKDDQRPVVTLWSKGHPGLLPGRREAPL